MMLDATAANRMMWKNKNPPNTIFMDKELDLRIPPDIFACWEKLPFREDVFDCIIFDPPHKIGRTKYRGKWANPKDDYLGIDISHSKFRTGLYYGTREFLRVSRRLCLKWNDIELSLHRILTLFPKEWKEICRKVIRKNNRAKTVTYWVTFVKNHGL